MQANGAAALAHALAHSGLRTVFSLSGNQIMPIYDACIDAGIRIVHVRHEAAAVYMAEAWAQVTGETGVALLTAGPGFANGLSPLASARQSESPVLLISGDAPVSGDGSGAFQELDQTAMTTPTVKTALRPTRSDEMIGALATCLKSACSGRKGPVHLALPFDLLTGPHAGNALPDAADLEPDTHSLSEADVKAIVNAVGAAERPIVVLGPQHSKSRDPQAIPALERAFGAPAVALESPRGLRDPSLGVFSECLAKADLLVCLGKPLDFMLGFAKPPAVSADARIIAIDPDVDALNRTRRLGGSRLAMAIQADTRAAIDALTAAATAAEAGSWTSDVHEAIAFRGGVGSTNGRPDPRRVCERVDALLAAADEPILICDGGEFGQWAQAFCTAPTRVINGPLGAIGGGLPYAIAAKIARPDATVAVLMGDGTAGFHFAEFETAARENAAIVAIIGNDFRWNAEHQIQVRDYGPDRLIGCDLSSAARYDLAAAAFGCAGQHVTDAGTVDAALETAFRSDRPVCVNIEIDGQAAPVYRANGPAPADAH
ncbi:MAG: thiamine pyrophosphate-binding protein [Pseudomonadota bacterium]